MSFLCILVVKAVTGQAQRRGESGHTPPLDVKSGMYRRGRTVGGDLWRLATTEVSWKLSYASAYLLLSRTKSHDHS